MTESHKSSREPEAPPQVPAEPESLPTEPDPALINVTERGIQPSERTVCAFLQVLDFRVVMQRRIGRKRRRDKTEERLWA